MGAGSSKVTLHGTTSTLFNGVIVELLKGMIPAVGRHDREAPVVGLPLWGCGDVALGTALSTISGIHRGVRNGTQQILGHACMLFQ